MRTIKYIILHCSGTEPDPHLGAFAIDRYHRSIGWDCIGYHFIVRTDGRVERGRILEKAGAHCLGFNKESIGVCYVGGTHCGKNVDTRTPEQKFSLEQLVKKLHKQYPKAIIAGHNDFTHDKDCPCFDVSQWLNSIGIESKKKFYG